MKARSQEVNSIIIPAAIIQTPFFNNNGQDYINYGLTGSIIGHELTHAFDNEGRLYDMDGKLNNWWTDNDSEEFIEFSQCFIHEYNSIIYDIENKKYNVNGERTLGENLADNGGLARAYDAWQLSLLKNPENAAERNKMLPGFQGYTIDQLFYISYGQTFCSINNSINLIDEHSPGIARINGVISNSKHFAETFNCPSNSPMNPENKCIIW
ncbi:zincin [Piromyces finnis]|uniref:Zincin n=1 Tax=Piromyces finnis TaxID=1754191 RepID=A0A1Y1VIC9_9FUNG|nr:zincin [Piromyces finnis]|eukprot:ORX57154.1 zincin [Piromyces finnis]